MAETVLDAPRARTGGALLLAALLLVALNLRPTLTSISPLLGDIRAATGLSFRLAGLLTTLPVLAMGVFALAGARVSRLFGDRHGVSLALLVIAAACGWRWSAASGAALIGSAALVGVGVALIQALLPGVIKHNYAARLPQTMGLYSAAIMGGGGLGAVVSPWVAHQSGNWHAGLGVWVVLALAALLVWRAVPGEMPPAASAGRGLGPLLRNRRAWLLALYFGLINGGYTSMVAWLPPFFVQRGLTAQHAGSLLGLMTAAQVVAALSLPVLALKSRDRRPWLALGLSLQLAGFAGLILQPDALPTLWVMLIGFGLGGCFALSLILTLDHLHEPRRAGELAAFVQGAGFVIAALAPFAIGWLRDAGASFTAGWLLLTVSAAAMLLVTRRYVPEGYAAAMHGIVPGE
ncbi:cyanate transporter [Neisseriaceae bacterium JH1-16]|nr:cyanate transporter [Neisseriaceae bacterium JH1-16]